MARQSNQPLGRRFLNLQTLEPREVPATTIALAGGVFSIDNTGNEAVTLTLDRAGANYTLAITGGSITVGAVDPNITYTGLFNGGTEATGANLVAAAGTLSFDLGAGADTLVVGTGDIGNLTPAAGVTVPISVTGGNGSDTIRLNDSTSAPAADFTVAGDSITRTTGSGPTAKTLSIALQDAFEAATVTAGTGPDRITLATAAGVALPAALSVDGGTGTDTLTLRDTDTNAHTYQVTNTSLERDARAFALGTRAFEAGEIQAGTGNDTVTVVNLPTVSGGSAPVTLSGGGGTDTVTVQNAGANAQLTVNGDAGNDTITVLLADATAALSVFGGDDNDTFRIGNASNPIGLIDGSISVDGGPDAGTDQLTVDDRSAASNHTYDLKAVGADFFVGHEGSGSYRYTGLDSLTLRTSDTAAATDTIHVTATDANVTVDGGAGTNRFHIGSNESTIRTLDGLGGDVAVEGGTANNQLFVVDSLDTDPNSYAVDADSISRTSGAVTRQISFDAGFLDSISLAVGTPALPVDANTITVAGTAGGSPLTVTGGAGNDQVTVGGGSLSDLDAAVTVNAGGGLANTLFVNDSVFGSARDITVGGTSIASSGGAANINYTGFKSLTLTAGTAADTLLVKGNELPFGSVNVFNGGTGADEITVIPDLAPVLPTDAVTIAVNGGAQPPGTGDSLFVQLPSVPNPLGVFIPDLIDPTSGTAAVLGYTPFSYTTIEEVGLDTPAIDLNGGGTLEVLDIASASFKIKFGDGPAFKVKGATLVQWTAGSAPGVDRVVYRDSGTTADLDYTVTADRVVRAGQANLNNFSFAGVEEVTIEAGSGDNAFALNAVPAGTKLVVKAGGGNDDVSGAATLAGSLDLQLEAGLDAVNLGSTTVSGTVSINGGTGNDTVSVGTATGAATLVGDVGDDSLSIVAAASTLNLDAGADNDTVTVGSVAGAATVLGGIGNDGLTVGAASAALRVDGGDDNDTVTAGTGGLDNWTATATLIGGAGSDRLAVVDSDSSPNTYAVTDTAVSRTTVGGASTFPYDPTDFEAIELRVGNGPNVVDVPSTAAGAPVTVIGGTGTDRVVVGSGTLDAIGSAVNVAGGGGPGDRLEVNDSAATAQSYGLSGTTVTRAAVAVTYSAFGQIVLQAGAGDDTVAVSDTAAGTTTVSAGDGKDTVTVTQTTGTITVSGGIGDDTVTVGTGNLDAVDGQVQVDGGAGTNVLTVADGTVNAVRTYDISTSEVTRTGTTVGTATIGFTGIGALTVNAGLQADTINVDATAAATPVTVNAGAGNDTVSVGDGDLDNLAGPLELVSGPDGADKLIVDDSAASAAVDKTYTVTATDAGTSTHSFAYFNDGFRAVELRGGLGDDTIDVPATAAGVPVTVGGGGGNDAINIGSVGDSLDQILGAVDVTGGGGTDRLTANDQGDAGPSTYTLGPSTFTRTGTATVTFNTLETLVLNASTGDDTVNVNDTAVPTTVNAGAGADSVTIAKTTSPLTVNAAAGNDTVTAGVGDLGELGGAVSVAGGTEVNALFVNDSTSGAAQTYSIGLGQVTRSGAAAINFSGVQTIDLTAGGLADQVAVPATAAGTTVVVNAGGGNDTVTVGGGDLDGLAGTLTLNAGAGATDKLVVDDSTEAIVARTYLVNATQVTGAGVTIPYAGAGFERVELLGGRLNDTATVEATTAGIPVTVNAGLGTDTVFVGTGNLNALLADVTVMGGTGTDDRLEVRDGTSTTANSYTLTDTALVRVTPTPTTRQIDYSGFDQVSVAAGTGSDAVLVSSTPTAVPVTVAGGDGNDTVTVGPLDNIRGPLNILGGILAADADVLIADDSTTGSGKTYTVEAAKVTRTTGTPVAIDFAAIDRVELKTGSQGDTVTVRAISAGITVSLFTAGGNDAIAVGDGSLDAIQGAFALDADVGADTLTVNDGADTDNNAYIVSDKQVTRNGNAPALSYETSKIEALVLLAGAGDDVIAVTSTAAGVPVTVNAGAGNDALAIGGGNLDNLQADVTLIGDVGSDGLVVDDSADTDDNAYQATGTTLTRFANASAGQRVVNHASFDTFALRAGGGNNVVDVLDMDKDVTIAGGTGNDTMTFGDGDLDGFPVGLDIAIAGGGGTDNRLILNDSVDSADNKYTLTPFAITRGTGPAFPYLGGFQDVLLRAGTGSDLIESDAAKGVNVSVDAGPGVNTFRIDYLGGSVIGGADIDTFYGRKRENASLQDGASAFVIDGPDSGTLADRLGGRFEGIENLVGGGRNDKFTFVTDATHAGSLSGYIRGEGGTDELFGDDSPRTYELTAAGKGSVLGLVLDFNDIESIFGGIRDDVLLIPDQLPNNGLSVFDGGRGTDTANFTEWTSAKTVSITGVGEFGFHLTDGIVEAAELDRHKFKNLDVVLGSPMATDTLVQTTNIPTGWVVQGGQGPSYVTEKAMPEVDDDAPDERLEFVGFEHLRGGDGPDTFRVDFRADTGPGPAALASSLLVTGGRGDNRLEVLGTNEANAFKMLPRTQKWPTGAVGTTSDTSVAGVQVTLLPENGDPIPRERVLYQAIQLIDLRGGDKADKFVVEPPAKAAGQSKANPLFGADVKDLVLQGGAGKDLFEVVPDKFNKVVAGKKNADPKVDFHVFGGTGLYFTVKDPATGKDKLVFKSADVAPTGQDTMVLYQLPLRVKANFPVGGLGGPPTESFELNDNKKYLYGAVSYYDFFTVVATAKKTTTAVIADLIKRGLL